MPKKHAYVKMVVVYGTAFLVLVSVPSLASEPSGTTHQTS